MERNKFAVMKIQCVLATILLLVQKSLTWQVDLRANLHLDFSGRLIIFNLFFFFINSIQLVCSERWGFVFFLVKADFIMFLCEFW